MRKIERLYTITAAIIAEFKDAGVPVLNVEDVVRRVREEADVSSADRKWLEDTVIKQAAETMICKSGQRSVVKGLGYFVDPEHCQRPEYAIQQILNADAEKAEKEAALKSLIETFERTGILGQSYIDPDTSELVVGMTKEELLAMLKADSSV